ncbi:MAG: Lrp/AsnC family transcriptional regulator, partial [Candidatus Woesearchaeota archaeon]|nr:Lrp/AsnC family transcriptional regulator [Candidatus Woesearchaeota archaeon]
MSLQDKDKKIIGLLKEEGRASIRDIAKKTNLRPSTVHQRLRKLQDDQVIEKFTVKLNNDAVEENFIVFILVNTKKHLSAAALSHPSIKEVFGVTGEFDLLIKCKFKDIVAFNHFIIEF